MVEREQALAWRARRHGLVGAASDAVDAVDRVVALRAWPAELAELSVTVRVRHPLEEELELAQAAGRVVRSYALRGGSYFFTPENAALMLAVRRTTRVWETDRYQRQGNFEVADWRVLRDAMREALASGPLTRREIGSYLAGVPALAHVADAAATGAGSDTLIKPLHWWGDVCFGPNRGGQPTFRWLAGDAMWPGTLEPDEAGPAAIRAYLRAYAPATIENLQYWFTEGLSVPKKTLRRWLDELGAEVASRETDIGIVYALADDIDAMQSAEPIDDVWFLPGFDPWVSGPGTADPWLLSPERRALASRGSNLVAQGGVIVGTWRIDGPRVVVGWFQEAGPPPTSVLERAVSDLAQWQQRELVLSIEGI